MISKFNDNLSDQSQNQLFMKMEEYRVDVIKLRINNIIVITNLIVMTLFV